MRSRADGTRRRMSLLPTLLGAIWAVAGLPGCGGGLKYTVDDRALDPVPANERAGVESARQDEQNAAAEQRAAESLLAELARDTDQARKEREQAQLETEKAVAEQEGAKIAHDENQANAAAHNKDIADLGVKVAEAHLDWLDGKRDWCKQSRRAADAHRRAALAKVELEKARVAQQKGIQPGAGFRLSDYEAQWRDQDAKWQAEKKDASADEKHAKKREDGWKDLSAQLRKLRGN